MRRRGELQQVELLDPTVPEEPVAAARRDRRRLWLIVAVAVVAVGLGGTQWVLTARENAAVARLAQVPGVLAPVDDTLEVVRRLAPEDYATLAGEPYGTLVVGEDGAQSYRWFAPADPGWTTQLLGPNTALEDASQVFTDSTCVTDETPGTATSDAALVVCLVTDGAQTLDDTGQVGGSLTATTRELVVLDTADGSVRARWPLPQVYDVVPLPGPVVVLDTQTDDGIEVTGHDALTGRELWRYDSEWAPGAWPNLFRLGDLVAFTDPSGMLTMVSPDGTVIRRTAATPGYADLGWGREIDPRRSTVVLYTQQPDGTARSLIISGVGDAADDVEVDGLPLEVRVDDGSAPDLLLTNDSAVHAYDARTGATRWTADVRTLTNALVVRGRVYLATDRAVVALDADSGRELWRTDELVGLTPAALLTDGTHVLAALERTGTSGVPALAAYDPATGAEVFRAPYPEGVIEVGSVGRTLVARDAASHAQVELG